jgi:hypothetical protein
MISQKMGRLEASAWAKAPYERRIEVGGIYGDFLHGRSEYGTVYIQTSE